MIIGGPFASLRAGSPDRGHTENGQGSCYPGMKTRTMVVRNRMGREGSMPCRRPRLFSWIASKR
jgi:hypothetical protein